MRPAIGFPSLSLRNFPSLLILTVTCISSFAVPSSDWSVPSLKSAVLPSVNSSSLVNSLTPDSSVSRSALVSVSSLTSNESSVGISSSISIWSSESDASSTSVCSPDELLSSEISCSSVKFSSDKYGVLSTHSPAKAFTGSCNTRRKTSSQPAILFHNFVFFILSLL